MNKLHVGDITVANFSAGTKVEINGESMSLPINSIVRIKSDFDINLTGDNFSVFSNDSEKEITNV